MIVFLLLLPSFPSSPPSSSFPSSDWERTAPEAPPRFINKPPLRIHINPHSLPNQNLATSSLLEDPWTDLTGSEGFAAWRASGQWYRTKEVGLKKDNPKLLEGQPTGGPILVNHTTGRTANLVTKTNYKDVEFSCEFMMGEKSNSGVKFIGHYEIQLFDSYGKKDSELTGSDCGGVYPRGEPQPRYHTIDRGSPPKTNVCKKPGEWQSLQIIFRAPRFDASGKKVEHARFIKVTMNGTVIQENVELRFPTGSAWRQSKEVPEGPILLQGDHGPVAFREVKVRPWKEPEAKQ